MNTVTGYVQWVKFDPSRRWFTAVSIASSPDNVNTNDYQIDGAKFLVEGREIDRTGLLTWLAGNNEGRAVPIKVVITGNFGAYPTYETASFTKVTA